MFDSDETAVALDEKLIELGVRSGTYRSMLPWLIRSEDTVYDLDAAKARALDLIKETYADMRTQATAAGFSERFSITLADMATRADLNPGGDRMDLYLYLMKSTDKKGLRSLTEAELDARNTHVVEVIVASPTFQFRVYANLTDAGVDLVTAQAAQLRATPGVVRYKIARPGCRWRRDTMVIYCTTRAGVDGALAWFRQLQRGAADPATSFAADVPHFTEPAAGLRGVSSVEDPDSGAESSYSELKAEMIRTAIDAGVSRYAERDPIGTYVAGIVARLDEFWSGSNEMAGKPKP